MVDSNENYKFDLGVKGLKVDLQARFESWRNSPKENHLISPVFAVAYLVMRPIKTNHT